MEFQSACAHLQFDTAEEERQLEFEKALRQLDGNFLQIDQSRLWEAERELYVSFQNPSVEEFVEQRLGNDLGMLKVSVSIVSFRQIRNLLEYIEEHATLLPKAHLQNVYTALRECAYQVIDPQSENFLSAPPQITGSRFRWLFSDRSGPVDRVQALLKLDKAAKPNDQRSGVVRSALSHHAYWVDMMTHARISHHTANALRHLAHWICDESGWPEEEVWHCMEAMRYAFHQLISHEDANFTEINSIQELIDGFWTVVEDWPTSDERKELEGNLVKIVDSLIEKSASSDDIATERHCLQLIEMIMESDYAEEISKLRAS